MKWIVLDEESHRETEAVWRDLFGAVFANRGRMRAGVKADCFRFARRGRTRAGAKADYYFRCERTEHWLIVPFLSNVAGLPMGPPPRLLSAYECRGPLVGLGDFRDAELFVSPVDFEWTFVSTHEDFSIGGPFFVRADWISQ